MTGKQIRAMIGSLEKDHEIYRAACEKFKFEAPLKAQVAHSSMAMTGTLIDMWKAALEAID